MVTFDDSCEAIRHSKVFVDFTTIEIYRGLGITYIYFSLINQSNVDRDVELQILHIFHFKSSRDMNHITTLKIQLSFKSKLADWYRDAESDPYFYFLTDFSLRTEDRLRCPIKIQSFHSKFNVPE